MRYGTETRLSPKDVLDRARAFFGVDGELGLPETTSGPDSLTFAAPSGGVNVSATATNGGHTDVTIISREYDYWAERFIRELH
jgi:hypothetical protein